MVRAAQADTSLREFRKKKEDGSLSADQEEVKKKIAAHQPVTLKEVAKHMDRYPNQISGRFTELREAGKIKITGETDDGRLYKVVE